MYGGLRMSVVVTFLIPGFQLHKATFVTPLSQTKHTIVTKKNKTLSQNTHTQNRQQREQNLGRPWPTTSSPTALAPPVA
jgi:hypothetical protein